MKTFLCTLSLCLFGISLQAADTIRVNNNSGVQADYTTLQAAHNAATSGDVIYLENSPYSYGGCLISKQLTIIGTGYFLDELENGPKQTAGSYCYDLYFNPGSEGSILQGVTIEGKPGDYGMIYVNASNIQILRNAVYNIRLTDNKADITDLIISQNYFMKYGGISQGGYGSCSNMLVCNNNMYNSVSVNDDCNGIIKNNIIGRGFTSVITNLGFENLTIQNNIIHYMNVSYNNCNVQNNIYIGVSGTNADGNVFNVLLEDVYLGEGTTDSQWQLKEGSPAIGAGIDGDDCGAFDGPYPYRPSGLPPVPYIYDATIPASGTAESGLPVTIKVRSNN